MKKNIKCPRCHSNKLYKFDLDKQANQTYQCPNCKIQFAPYFKLKVDKFKKQSDLQSDDWHSDETVVFINGIKHYLWLVIDSETRFIVCFHLSKYRDDDSAFSFITKAKKYASLSNLITYR